MKKKKMIYAHTEFSGKKLPDTQNDKASVELALQKVGIRQFVHPAHVVKGCNNGDKVEVEVPADFSMYVDLSAKNKGISMSRLPRLLASITETSKNTHIFNGPQPKEQPWMKFLPRVMRQWSYEIFNEIPGTKNAYIKAHLKIPKMKMSPKSGLEAAEYYDTTWEISANEKHISVKRYLTVTVRYISTCPCSLHLSEHAEKTGMVKRANPHMQPAYAKIKLDLGINTFLDEEFLFELIERIEKTLVTIPYPMVKREDEQAIAIACGKHQMFTEDASRLLAKMMEGLENEFQVNDWVIVCDHDESIHSHFATSITWKGVPGGLR